MDAAAHVPRRRGFTSDLRTVWQGRGFRRLYAVRLSSQTADGMFEAALGGLFFFSPERATTPTAIAVAFGVALGSSAVSITSQPAQKTASANAMAKINNRFIVNTAPLAS